VNLLALIEQLAEAAAIPAGVSLDVEYCLHLRDKRSDCEACFALCPTGAIEPGKPPSFNQDACVRCRACLPVCPTQAYQATDEIIPLLKQAMRIKGRRLELVCGLHPNEGSGLPEADVAFLTRGCLAGLGAGTYLALLALRLDEIVLRTDACADCPLGGLQDEIDKQATAVSRLLYTWPNAGSVRCTGPLNSANLVKRAIRLADTPPLSRRELFRLNKEQPSSIPAWLEGSDEAARPSTNHRLIMTALAKLDQPHPALSAPVFAGLGLASIVVDDDTCTACGVCARACPTAALYFTEEDQVFRLSFAAPNCIGCELCAHVCMPESITVEHNPSWDQLFPDEVPVTLLTGPLTSCERCHSRFFARDGQRYCAICEIRRQNPFASLLPCGFERERAEKA
jgi:ferredoxin